MNITDEKKLIEHGRGIARRLEAKAKILATWASDTAPIVIVRAASVILDCVLDELEEGLAAEEERPNPAVTAPEYERLGETRPTSRKKR